MRTAIEQLPDDIETLKRLIIERDALVEAKRLEVVEARLLIEKLKLQIARYKAHPVRVQIRASRRAGRAARTDRRGARSQSAAGRRNRPRRRPRPMTHLPKTSRTPAVARSLPRTTQEHAPACGCPACGTALKRMGEDVSEYLEFVSRALQGDPDGAAQDELPQVLDGGSGRHAESADPKGIAGPGLLAHVAVSKYLDHLPLYRQSEIYARQGIDLDRSTMAGWIGPISAWWNRWSMP